VREPDARAKPEMLQKLQRGLEGLYRIATDACVSDFLIDATTRARLGVARAPREQLLVSEDDGGLSLGLFVDGAALSNLAIHDPVRRLDERNLGDFLLAIEGVSHFVYLTWRAQSGARVSALELELQAEVDKYVTCLLCGDSGAHRSAALRRRLFDDVAFDDDLDAGERDRYHVANANAYRYSESLERRYVRIARIAAMLDELRRFYRMPLAGKLELIRAA
jgi:hypothetical protein